MTTTETKTTERIARRVMQYVFTHVNDEGFACYDEVEVQARWLADKPKNA
jgi:hypothetical protein